MQRKTIFILFFCFIIYGWIELEALILIGSIFGGLVAFLGLFLTAFAGIFLIRLLTKNVFMAWQSKHQNIEYNLSKLSEGLSILFGGLLLVIPGYFTDLIGIICMMPIIRVFIGSIIIANFADLKLFASLRTKHGNHSPNRQNTKYEAHEITIDGEYKEK